MTSSIFYNKQCYVNAASNFDIFLFNTRRMWGPKVAVRPKVAVLVKIAVRPKVAVPAQCHRVMLLQNFLIENVLSYTF